MTMEKDTAPGITPEQLLAMRDAIVEVWETVRAAVQAAAACIREGLLRVLLLRYRLRRVYHLAFYARKRRVRKKNLRRLLRLLTAA